MRRRTKRSILRYLPDASSERAPGATAARGEKADRLHFRRQAHVPLFGNQTVYRQNRESGASSRFIPETDRSFIKKLRA